MNIELMRQIVKDTDYLDEVLQNEVRIPVDMRHEGVTAEGLIEFAKENAWVLEMAISIANKIDKMSK
tara:strand:+ start:6879 stop:7079 length:201 start_codon:yes stop_codon:yes gene_type:complete